MTGAEVTAAAKSLCLSDHNGDLEGASRDWEDNREVYEVVAARALQEAEDVRRCRP